MPLTINNLPDKPESRYGTPALAENELERDFWMGVEHILIFFY